MTTTVNDGRTAESGRPEHGRRALRDAAGDGRSRAGRIRRRTHAFDPLLLATAILGLVWNLCALPRTSCRRSASQGPFPVPGRDRFRRARLSAGGRRPLGAARRAGRRRGGIETSARGVAYARQRGRRAPARPALRWVRPVPSPLGMRLLTYTFVALVVPLAAVDAGTARRAPRAVGGRAGDLRRLRAASEPAASGRRVLAGRAPRPSRVAAAGARDPLSGLPVRARRSVPQARAGAAGARRDRVRRHRDVRRRSSAFADFVQLDPRRSASSSRSGSPRRCCIRCCVESTAWFVDTIVLRRPDYALAARDASPDRCRRSDDIAALLCRRLRPARARR